MNVSTFVKIIAFLFEEVDFNLSLEIAKKDNKDKEVIFTLIGITPIEKLQPIPPKTKDVEKEVVEPDDPFEFLRKYVNNYLI
jgi:hypothetical protein